MDEIQKTEMRNYAMAAGFFVLAAAFIVRVVGKISLAQAEYETAVDSVSLISALILILAGVILVILKNRDLTAITFLMTGMFMAVTALDTANNKLVWSVIGIFMIILSAIILTSKDTKKFILFIIPALIGLQCILLPFFVSDSPVIIVIRSIIGLLCLYFAFACASERIALPGSALLKADVVTDFKASGSVLGYLLFSITTAVWSSVYFLGVSPESAIAVESICSLMLIFSGVLLWAVGKMRFTPVMFILIGFLSYVDQFMTGYLFFVVGGLYIVLGLFAILRKESRIIPALMLIIYGFVFFITVMVTGTAPIPILGGLLNLIPSIIAIYLAFAVFSQRKLPLF